MDPFLIRLYASLPRQGPGLPKYTIAALSQTDLQKRKNPSILELGCGTGGATVTLAQAFPCQILATDVFEEVLNPLREKCKKLTFKGKIEVKNMDMRMKDISSLGKFDAIWAEGSLFIMGFKNGFEHWKKAIKPGGWMVVSDLAWLTENPPKEVKEYFDSIYPMKTIEENVKIIKETGFEEVKTLVMEKDGWMDEFYTPQNELMQKLMKNESDQKRIEMLKEKQKEIEIYEKYWESYSYAFYICKLGNEIH
jgi:cyclopropane fatty-acyl-phospholipid synthase-like methyltransferase